MAYLSGMKRFLISIALKQITIKIAFVDTFLQVSDYEKVFT